MKILNLQKLHLFDRISPSLSLSLILSLSLSLSFSFSLSLYLSFSLSAFDTFLLSRSPSKSLYLDIPWGRCSAECGAGVQARTIDGVQISRRCEGLSCEETPEKSKGKGEIAIYFYIIN